MSKSFLHTEIGERVEQSDFEHASADGQRQILQSIATDLFTGDSVSGGGQPQNYVLEGFESSDPYGVLPGTTVTINGGKAIVGFRDTAAEFGMVVSGGATSRNLDMNALLDGTYGVYIRAAFNDDRFLNRLFWNALAVTPVETPRSIATRRTEDWELAIEMTSPGSEYMLIAQAVKVGSQITLTDKRRHFFEGELDNLYTVPDSEWGGGNDRNADRALYGVKSVERAMRGILRQVQDIIGETGPVGWWRTIEYGLKVMLPRDGARTLTGVLTPDGTNTRNLGSDAARFASMYLNRIINLGGDLYATAIAAAVARITAPYSDVSGAYTCMWRSERAGASSANTLRIYVAESTAKNSTGALLFTWNAYWNPLSFQWERDAAGQSLRFQLGSTRAHFDSYPAASASPWADSSWVEAFSPFTSTGVFSFLTLRTEAIEANGVINSADAITSSLRVEAPNVKAQNFTYTATQTRTVRIAACEGMVPALGGATNWTPQMNSSTPGGIGLSKLGTGDTGITIPFDQLVPNGAIITGCTVHTTTYGSSGGANEIRVGLFRQNHLLVAESLNDGGSGYDVVTPHGSGAIQSFVMTVGASESIRTVDKSDYVYGFWMGARGASQPQIEDIVITYELDIIDD